jgi:hypothetical protein
VWQKTKSVKKRACYTVNMEFQHFGKLGGMDEQWVL